MAMNGLNRLRWHGREMLRSVGLAGWVAIGLLQLCAIGRWSFVEPMSAEASRLDGESTALEKRWAAKSRADDSTPATAQQQLAAFRQRFPDEKGMAPALRRLQGAARRQQVAIDQAEFKFASEPTEPLARYSIILPLKAGYPELRRFTRDALRDLPALALEDVNLRRGDPKSPVLEAQLRFVLFVSKPSTAWPALAAAPSN